MSKRFTALESFGIIGFGKLHKNIMCFGMVGILLISIFANIPIQGEASSFQQGESVDTDVLEMDDDTVPDFGSALQKVDWENKLSLGIKSGLPYDKEYVTVVVATNNMGKLHRLMRHYGGVPYVNSNAVTPKNFDYTALSYEDSDRMMMKEISIPGYAIPHLASQNEVVTIFERPEIKTMLVSQERMKMILGDENADLSSDSQRISSYTELGSTSDPHKVKDVWEYGFDGEGINIAIVDTGTDFSNADLIDQWAVAPEGNYSGAGWPIMLDPGSMELYLTTNATGVNRTAHGGYPVGFEDHGDSRYTQTNFTFQPTNEPIEVVNETIYHRYQESHPEELGYTGTEEFTKNLKGVGLHSIESVNKSFNATGKLVTDTTTDSLSELIDTKPTSAAPGLVMDEDGWYTVGSSSPFGEYNSLKLNTSGDPHISYYDRALGALGYAYWNGTHWINETVDNSGDVGMYSSLGLDSSENPCISYFDSTYENLKYAYWDGTQWNIEIADNYGSVGRYSSLIIDSSDRAHIFYHHDTKGDNKGNLKYAYRIGPDDWTNDNEINIIFDQGKHVSSAAFGHNKHIIFYDSANNRLRYKEFARFNWDTSSSYIDDGGMYSSISVDSSGYPHISHYDPINSDLKYLYRDGSGWHSQVVDHGVNVGMYTSIAIDSYDLPHIVYFSDQYVNYTVFDGSDWSFETLYAVGTYANTSLALDNDDVPHFSYYSSGHKALNYVTKDVDWNSSFLPRDLGDKDVGEMLDLSLDMGTTGGWTESIHLDLRYSVNEDNGNIVDWETTNLSLINTVNNDVFILPVEPKSGDNNVSVSIDITEKVNALEPENIDLEVIYTMNYTGTLPGPTVNFDYINLRASYEPYPDVYHNLWISNEKAFEGVHYTGESYKPVYLPDYELTDDLTITNREQNTVVRELIFIGNESDQRNLLHKFEYPNIDLRRVDFVDLEQNIEIRYWNEENYTFDSTAGTIRLDVDIPNGSKIYVNYGWNFVWSARRIFEDAILGTNVNQTGDELTLPERYLSGVKVYYVDSNGKVEWDKENYDVDHIEGVFTLNTDLPIGSGIDMIYQYSYVHVGSVYDEAVPNELGVHKLNNTHISNVTVNADTPTGSGEWGGENYFVDRQNGTIEILNQLLNGEGTTEGCYINITYEWGRVPRGRVREEAFVGTAYDDTGSIYHTENKNIKNVEVYRETMLWNEDYYELDTENGTIELLVNIPEGTTIYIHYDWEYHWLKPAFDIDTGKIILYKGIQPSNSETFVTYSGYNLWNKDLYTIDKQKGEITLYTQINNNEAISINYVCGGGDYDLMEVSIPKMQYPANDTWGQEHFWTIYNMTELPAGLVSQSGVYKFGLSKANHLADMWGEHVGMLLIDSETPGLYDQILVDINRNYDFQDEKPVNKSSPLAFTELKSYEDKGIISPSTLHPLNVRDNYEFAWMGNDATEADIVLSAGLLYWIADGEHSLPYAERYVEILGYDNASIPEQGNLVGFFDDWGSHGTSTASAAVGTGQSAVKNSAFIFNKTDHELKSERFKEITSLGTAPNAKVIGIGMLAPTGGSMEASWRFASEGYDGIPGTGDEAVVNSNSWGSFVDNAGWFYYDRLAMELSKEYPNTVLVASAGNQGNGYGTLGSPGSSPAVITVAAGTDMAYRTYLGNNLDFLQFLGSGSYPSFGGTIGDGDPRNQRPYGDVVDFSSRGPNLLGQPGVDVFAAGAFAMVAYPPSLAFSEGTTGRSILGWYIFKETNARVYSPIPRNNSHSFDLFSGTSLSAPVTAGITALVYQAFESSHGRAPTNEEVKQIIMAAADDHEFDPLQQGAGWVNATRAVELAMQLEGAYSDTEYWSPGEFDGMPRAGMGNLMYPGDSYEDNIGLNTMGGSVVTNVSAVVYKKTLNYTFDFDAAAFDGTATLARNDAVEGSGVYRRTDGMFTKIYDDTDGVIQNILNTTGFIKITGMQDGERNAYVQIFNWQDANETLIRDGNTTSGGNGILDGEGYAGEPARDERSRLTWTMDKGRYVTTYVHNPRDRIHEGLIIQSRSPGYEMYGNITIEAYEKVDWDWIDIKDVSNEGFNVTMNVPLDTPVGGYQGTIIYETDNQHTGLIPVFVNVAGLPELGESFYFGGGEPEHGLYSNSRIGGNGFYDSRFFYLNYNITENIADNSNVIALLEQMMSNYSVLSMNLYGQTSSSFSGDDFGSFSMTLVAESKPSDDPYWTMLQLTDYLRENPKSLVILEVRCDEVGDTDEYGERFEGRIGQIDVSPTSFVRYNEPIGEQTINVTTFLEIPEGLAVLVPEVREEKDNSLPINDHPYVGETFVEYLADAPNKQIVTIPEGTLSFTFNLWGHSDADDYDLGIFWSGEDDEYIVDGKPTVDGFVAYDGNPSADETVTILDPKPGRYWCMIAGYAVDSGLYDYDWLYYIEGESVFEARNVTNETIIPQSGVTNTSFEIAWNLFDTLLFTCNKTENITEGEIPQWLRNEFEANDILVPGNAAIYQEGEDLLIKDGEEYLYLIDEDQENVSIYDRGNKSNNIETMIFVSPGVSPLSLMQVIEPQLVFDPPIRDPPEVNITRPTGGETWYAGDREEITWNTTLGDGNIIGLDIDYSIDGGYSWTNIVSNIEDNGSYTWTVTDETTTEAKIRVTVHDDYGMSSTNTSGDFIIDLKVFIPPEPYNVGWNFVSFNVIPSDSSLISILEDPTYGISGNYDKVMYYDASEDQWQSYVPGRAEHFNNLDTWNQHMGIWINMTNSDDLAVQGVVPSITNITLYPGWNMVGYPSSESGNNGLPTEIEKIGYFEANATYDVAYSYDSATFEFQPGKGYWLYNGADYAVTWTVEY